MVGRTVWILNHHAVTPEMDGWTRHFDLGRELIKRGYEAVIFASGFDHSTKQYVKVAPKERFRTPG